VTNRILCISFSPLHRDSRVRRQLAVLREFGDVTTVGYGPAPEGVAHHVEVPDGAASLPQTPGGVLRLALRAHESVELRSPGERAALPGLAGSGPYDLVVANDARALPLAFAVADGAPVLADLHEWAPEENSTSLPWRLLVGPYMDALCRKYLPRVAAATTVSGAIAELYGERYGVTPEVVRNTIPDQKLRPSAMEEGRIRLVHSGVATPERNIEGLIDAVARLDDRFSLDLFLVGEAAYLGTLRLRAQAIPRVGVHPSVPPAELPATLNRFDLGVYLLPVKSLNHRLMLPNKFFDFVQARLGLVFGPSVETDRLIAEYGLGIVTVGTATDDLVAALSELTGDDVARFKVAADVASATLNSESDLATQRALIGRLVQAG
jgi:glycosyltransferase involved in cell wall biosynthesis